MGNENVTVANGPNPTSRSTEYSAIHQSNSEVSDTCTHANDTPTMRLVTRTAPATPATQAIQGNAANHGSSVPTSYSTPRHPANIQDADPVSRMSGCGSAQSTPGLTLFSEPESGGHTTEVLATAPMVKREALEQCMTLDFNRKKWPSNIELVFPDGSSTKLNLTDQNPLVHTIVQDVIENLQASLMFHHAFPDVMLAFRFSKESLITAAEKHKPGAAILHSRLLEDEDYLMKMTQLPRARISLMRAEVKERCNAVTRATLLAMDSPSKIAEVIRRQLTDYLYTYPIAAKTGILAGVPWHTCPYQNPHIITVIRESFFTENGRTPSFVSRFGHLFPVHQDGEGQSNREVPEPMVALVATALYATLYEWRNGKQQATGFSANKYLDVYRGHIDTLKIIKDKQPSAYHVMMVDIYTQASAAQEDSDTGVVVANIDLNSLED
ncbi:hypothetical protein EI94DRAFT_1697128 [Lactarius quietus]|nr:hypothetical protein EI94DRAFT_1697128 [Lactarius quietus]